MKKLFILILCGCAFSLLAEKGCFDRSLNPLLYDEVMQARQPEYLAPDGSLDGNQEDAEGEEEQGSPQEAGVGGTKMTETWFSNGGEIVLSDEEGRTTSCIVSEENGLKSLTFTDKEGNIWKLNELIEGNWTYDNSSENYIELSATGSVLTDDYLATYNVLIQQNYDSEENITNWNIAVSADYTDRNTMEYYGGGINQSSDLIDEFLVEEGEDGNNDYIEADKLVEVGSLCGIITKL